MIDIGIGIAIAFLIETAIAVKFSWLVRMIKEHNKRLKRKTGDWFYTLLKVKKKAHSTIS